MAVYGPCKRTGHVGGRVHVSCTRPVHGHVTGPYTGVPVYKADGNGRVGLHGRVQVYTCTRPLHRHVHSVYGPCTRHVYTARVHGRFRPCTRAVYTVRVHGPSIHPSTGPFHGPYIRPVYTAVYLHVYTMGRNGVYRYIRVHGREYTAVNRPCTRPCAGRVYGSCARPCTSRVRGRVHSRAQCINTVFLKRHHLCRNVQL